MKSLFLWGRVSLSLLLMCGFMLSGTVQAAEQDSSKFTDAERAEIESIVKNYLLENPKVMQEVGQELASMLEEERRDAQTEAVISLRGQFVTEGVTPVFGNPKGDIDVVVFLDYNCGYCRRVLPVLEELVADDPYVRVVVREYPVFGEASVDAAMAALAAQQQGKYSEFHHKLISVEGEKIDEGVAEEAARSVGLDLSEFRSFMSAELGERELAKSHVLADALHIRGTPAFVVGNVVIPGMVDLNSLKKVISQERR